MPPSENRNRPPAAAASSSGDEAPQWCSLLLDLVQLVGWRVLAGDLRDYIRFRAVCTDWRSSTVCPLGRGIVDPRFHPRRWTLLPEGHGLHSAADGNKRFFNLSTGSFVRVRLPLLTNHQVLASAQGLLLLSADSKAISEFPLLLHPFTGDILKLPRLMHLLAVLTPGFEQCLELDLNNLIASLDVSADGTVAVMIVYKNIPRVLYATTHDKHWRISAWKLAPSSTTMAFKGKLYILQPQAKCSSRQSILQLNPPLHDHATMSSSLLPPTLIATCPPCKSFPFFDLAVYDSEILVIGFGEISFGTQQFVVYRVSDLAIGKVAPIESIGGNTIFLGIKMSMSNDNISISKSLTSSYGTMPTIASDTIVFHQHGYLWQYHLGTHKWSQILGGCVNDGYYMAHDCNCGLIYHIYQCCHCTNDRKSLYVFIV